MPRDESLNLPQMSNEILAIQTREHLIYKLLYIFESIIEEEIESVELLHTEN